MGDPGKIRGFWMFLVGFDFFFGLKLGPWGYQCVFLFEDVGDQRDIEKLFAGKVLILLCKYQKGLRPTNIQMLQTSKHPVTSIYCLLNFAPPTTFFGKSKEASAAAMICLMGLVQA